MEVERKIGIDAGWKDSIYGSTLNVSVITGWKNDISESTQVMGKKRFIIDQNGVFFNEGKNKNRQWKDFD